ncbi:hypothetical protein [Hoeflea ulvae]|uniref:Uncharacterized protein n=1 Tax=Hoeflea ulvae TaxID=2983764 RepID=A0ABT3YFA9_9HYPH|nr:hypothetical protein [Hoeflea ulvae]MCY0094586.1 hypothetical protein [Hoeflea ulvae]
MTSRRSPSNRLELVTLATQDDRERLAMVMMQIDMALALAREKGFVDVESYLEAALEEARRVHGLRVN